MTYDRVLMGEGGRRAHYLDPSRPGMTICDAKVGMVPFLAPKDMPVCPTCDTRAAVAAERAKPEAKPVVQQLGLFGGQ